MPKPSLQSPDMSRLSKTGDSRMFKFGQPKVQGSIVVVSDERVNTKTFYDDDDEVLAGSV